MSNNNIKDEEKTLGLVLKSAREKSDLSVNDISKRLKLTATQISRLEQDDYASLGAATFVRGYIKSYCSLVKLPLEETLALYCAPPVSERTKNMQSFSRRTEKEAHDSWLMWLSYLIIAVVISASGYWFWQNNHLDTIVTGVFDTVEHQKVGSPLDTEADSELSTFENEFESEVVNKTPVINNDKTIKLNSALNTNDSFAESLATVESANNERDVTIVTSQDKPIDTPLPSLEKSIQNDDKNSTIVMRFSDESWVEIFDASQERVAFGIKKPGYEMTVTGTAPFYVILGKHQYVEVELDGVVINLSNLPKNRLAKFNLPIAE